MDLETLHELLEQKSVEDVAAIYRSRSADADSDQRDIEEVLFRRILQNKDWNDPRMGAEALLLARDIALSLGLADGDTETYLTIRAVGLQPEDEDVVLDYLRAVAEGDYRYTDKSLLDVANEVDDASLARRLATLDTFCEYMVLRAYLGGNQVYDDAMRHSLQQASELGMTRQAWLDAHAWLSEKIPYARVPDDVYDEFGPG